LEATVRRLLIVLALLSCLCSATPAAAQEAPPSTIDGPAAAQQLLDLVNGLRAENGVAPLTISLVAGDVALDRSVGLYECNYCSLDHNIPGVGYAPNWEISQIRGAIGAGENLGITWEPNDQFVQVLFDSWVASPTHLENLLRPQWTHMGLGVLEIQYRPGLSQKVVTQLFVMANAPLSRA
jgi:uncharacterized protein YkwD